MEDTTPGDQFSEEPQTERGAVGSRDTGAAGPSGGPVDRPEGAIEGDESVPSMGSDGEGGGADTAHGGAGTLPPQNSEPALPPYDGRQTHAKPEGDAGDAGGKNEGAAVPTSDPG